MLMRMNQASWNRAGWLLRFVGMIWLAACCELASIQAQVSAPATAPPVAGTAKPQDPALARPAVPEVAPQAQAEQEAAELVLSILMALDHYQTKQPLTGKLAVFGTPTMGALAHRWAEGFKRFHPQAEVEISEMKGAETLKRLAETPDGVAMISRPLYAAEIEALQKAGMKQPLQIEVGQQGMGVFVHSSNPLVGIDQQQFLRIFSVDESGEPTIQSKPSGDLTWGELGVGGDWATKPVHVVHRDAESGTHSFLKNQLLANRKLRPAKLTLDSTKAVLEAIAKDPQAIGLSNLRSALSQVKSLKLLQGTEEISCSDSAILSGAYPLVRRITLVVDAKSEAGMALAREFVKFSICQEGQREAILAGFFPLDPPLLRGQKLRLDSDQVAENPK